MYRDFVGEGGKQNNVDAVFVCKYELRINSPINSYHGTLHTVVTTSIEGCQE